MIAIHYVVSDLKTKAMNEVMATMLGNMRGRSRVASSKGISDGNLVLLKGRSEKEM